MADHAVHPDQYERLGIFYLGRQYDLDARALRDELVLYDARDLTTHAVCVGMTGSGKTGLCITLLEEAALDGIPALVIDPKGDLANLLLTFPELRREDFSRWTDPDDARREGITPDELGEKRAELWREGLQAWGMSPERIATLRDAADMAVYTPGSEAGLPLSVLASFHAPPPNLRDDADLFRDRVSTTAAGLLGLMGIEADPIRSREHILVSTIFSHQWSAGKDLDLPTLIELVQQPPVDRIGVLDLESFYPAKSRFELALALNNLLAAPGFASWLHGQPLDVGRLLYTESGKPRVSILSIAHLSDAERMFIVSLVLSETLSWMRGRPGTSSLRAILYMDEIFGYLPPVAEPPSKKPLLTLLKQARAYGLGLVLATQNPVDLDYKALSNIGTWFLGRLQTERDKARVLDGLEGATAGSRARLNRAALDRMLAALGNRIFLMHNVHEDAPVLFQTRWALSYLRGPMTRDQIRELMAVRRPAEGASDSAPSDSSGPAPDETSVDSPDPAPAAAEVEPDPDDSATAAVPVQEMTAAPAADRPLVPPGIDEVFVATDGATPLAATWKPYILGVARVHFVDARRGLEADEHIALSIPLASDTRRADWHLATVLPADEVTWDRNPGDSRAFQRPPQVALQAKRYATWRRTLTAYLYRTRRHPMWQCKSLKLYSRADESERDFRIRLSDRAHEERDREIERLRAKYGPKLARLEKKVHGAERTLEREEEEANTARTETLISFGTTVLSTLLGRKRVSTTNVGRASTTARKATRATRQSRDVAQAKAQLDEVRGQVTEMNRQLEADIVKLRERYDPQSLELTEIRLTPRKSDIEIELLALAWR